MIIIIMMIIIIINHQSSLLTREKENEMVKAMGYWPESESSHLEFINDRTVRLESEEKVEDLIIRKLVIRDMSTRREQAVVHLQYLGWPDKEVPQDFQAYASVLKLYREKRDRIDPSTEKVLVHCSAGVGRTGAFLAIDILLDHLSRSAGSKVPASINVAHLVFELRKQRQNMVQTFVQYEFVANFVAYCVQSALFMEPKSALFSPTHKSKRIRPSLSSQASRRASDSKNFSFGFMSVTDEPSGPAAAESSNGPQTTTVKRKPSRQSFGFGATDTAASSATSAATAVEVE